MLPFNVACADLRVHAEFYCCVLRIYRLTCEARKTWTRIGHFGKQFTPTLHANSLVRRYLWWSRWDSNPRPLLCESDYRQNAKYLPFRKLQPPREINDFPVLSHSLPSRIRRVLFFLATYWPLGNSSIDTLEMPNCHLKRQARVSIRLFETHRSAVRVAYLMA